jgi:hypothetical protein
MLYRMSSGLPTFPAEGPGDDSLPAQLGTLVTGIHMTWGQARERRRMRAFGFIPANEVGVLKRDWHGQRIRVSAELLRVIAPGQGELTHRADDGVLRMDGRPFAPTPAALAVADTFVELVRSYERWVEAREGREGRLSRGTGPDRRHFNALAETRRVQRLLGQHMRQRPK